MIKQIQPIKNREFKIRREDTYRRYIYLSIFLFFFSLNFMTIGSVNFSEYLKI